MIGGVYPGQIYPAGEPGWGAPLPLPIIIYLVVQGLTTPGLAEATLTVPILGGASLSVPTLRGDGLTTP